MSTASIVIDNVTPIMMGLDIFAENITIMRDDTSLAILKNVNLPEEDWNGLTAHQQQVLRHVKVCMSIMDKNILMPTADLRDELVKETGMSSRNAYRIIMYARQVVGQSQPTSKRAVREELLEMMRIEYQQAIKLKGSDRIDAVVKIAKVLVKGFNLGEEEGEGFNIAQYLEDNEVQFSSDPGVIGITLTEKQIRLMAKTKRKYLKELADVEDATVVEDDMEENVEEDEEGVSA